MRIVCPACAAAYEVPDGRLLPGRVVRCARCETDWAPVAEETVAATVPPEPEPEPEPEHEAGPEAVAEPEPEVSVPMVVNRRDAISGRTQHVAALRVAWALSVAALLAALWFGYTAREAVMQAWPPSARAYAALGLVGRH